MVLLFTAAAGCRRKRREKIKKDLNLSSGSYDTNEKTKRKAETRSGTEPDLIRHRKESIHQEQHVSVQSPLIREDGCSASVSVHCARWRRGRREKSSM